MLYTCLMWYHSKVLCVPRVGNQQAMLSVYSVHVESPPNMRFPSTSTYTTTYTYTYTYTYTCTYHCIVLYTVSPADGTAFVSRGIAAHSQSCCPFTMVAPSRFSPAHAATRSR